MPPHSNISQATIDQVASRADLLDIAQHFHPELKKQGKSYKGKCPQCNSDNFAVTPSKEIVKCFSCGHGAQKCIGYLVKMRGMTFVEAIQFLADRYNIQIEYESDYIHPDHLASASNPPQYTQPNSFRDEQLRASGISEEAQQYTVKVGDDDQIRNRYDHGTLDSAGDVKPGYDMLLHYLDLDGKPITYKQQHTRGKTANYIRIRFVIPRKDKDGKSFKYKSPAGGGNHLWIPESIRKAFKEGAQIPVLAFIEGEKKADALCLAGIPAAGIAGIHNFAIDNEMPDEIERLIRACGVQSVVFFVDSDYDDLGENIPTPADMRPRTFYSAAIKFKSYFTEFRFKGLPIEIFLAHGINRELKGMDDLLVHLRGEDTSQQLPSLADDLQTAMRSHERAGQHIRAYDLTVMHPLKIEEIWHLHSTKAFKDHHADRLKSVSEFRLHGVNYHWDKDENTFVVSDKLMSDEKFWRKTTNARDKVEYSFYNTGFYEFLSRRGYGNIDIGNDQYRLVHVEKNIVTAVDYVRISRFVIDFTKTIDDPEVLELIYRGGRMYIGPDRLSNLPIIEPAFFKPQRDKQLLFFTNEYWEVTPNNIKAHKYTGLNYAAWRDDIIPFSPTLIENPLKLTITEDKDQPKPTITCNVPDKADIVKYFTATSDILWRTSESGNKEDTDKRIDVLYASLADKIIAAGYTLSGYMDPSLMKAVICMDALESEVGRSEGGTGKSIFATMFEYLIPTVVISAKNPRLAEDPHLYEQVNERTKLIDLDDCRKSFDFESFLADITRGITVNPKGLKRIYVGLKRWIVTTNHSIRGEDRSYLRRQYVIAFSDYFNQDRTPFDVFGHAMFVEWDHDQFNWFYNFMAGCLQVFMIHGLKTFAPSADIKRRKLRDFISEPVLEFLETYFYHGSEFINSRMDIQEAIKYYLNDNPNQRQYVTKRYMRDRIRAFAEYAGYEYNPSQKGGRIRDGSKNIEYFILADHTYWAGVDATKPKLSFGGESEKDPF